MKKILVSVISEQTIPNLLLIKEMEGRYDGLLFISTKQMEAKGQGRWIERAANICENSVIRVIVNPDSIRQVIVTLENEIDFNNEYVVNLTGGTKPMSLAIYHFFKRGNNRIVYLPIGKNEIREFFPNEVNEEIKYRLKLKEYFNAYGISYKCLPKKSLKPFDFLNQILKTYRKKGFDSSQVTKDYANSDIYFFTGTWFEQYVYHILKVQFQLKDDEIGTDLWINNFEEKQRAGADNQLDIAFTSDNELYIIEAKVSIGREKLNKSNLDNMLFKLSAINRNFGLKSNPYLITLADLSKEPAEFHSDLQRKLRVLGIVKIEDRSSLNNKKLELCQKKYF